MRSEEGLEGGRDHQMREISLISLNLCIIQEVPKLQVNKI